MTMNRKKVTFGIATMAMLTGFVIFSQNRVSADAEKETVAEATEGLIEDNDNSVVESMEEIAKEEVAATTESKTTTSTRTFKTVVNSSAISEESEGTTVKVVATGNSSNNVAPEASTESSRETAATKAAEEKADAKKAAEEAEAKAMEEATVKAESESSDKANEIAQTPSLMDEIHQHYEEVRGKYTYVYDSNVESPYREGNYVYFPYEYLG